VHRRNQVPGVPTVEPAEADEGRLRASTVIRPFFPPKALSQSRPGWPAILGLPADARLRVPVTTAKEATLPQEGVPFAP